MIRLATAYDIPAMKTIWDDGFHDPLNYIDFVFNDVMRSSDAVVFEEKGKVVAMLLMISTKFVIGDEYAHALYILGAATLKKYRNRGIMSHLLDYAETRAKNSGAGVSILVPGERYLFDYYKKRGYSSDFDVRIVKLRAGMLSNAPKLEDEDFHLNSITADELYDIRYESLADIPHIEWARRQLSFVIKDAYIYGDNIAHCDSELGRAYAFYNVCRKTINVKELQGSNENVRQALLRKIVVNNAAHHAKIRLPLGDKLFEHEGSSIHYGMAKPLGDGGSFHDINPYMSLMLD